MKKNYLKTTLFIFFYSTYVLNATSTKIDSKTVNVVLKTEIDLSKNKHIVLKSLHNIKNMINSIKRDVVSRRNVGRAMNVWKFAADIDANSIFKAIRSNSTIESTTTTTTEIIDKELRGSAQYIRPYSYYLFDIFDTILLMKASKQDSADEYVEAIRDLLVKDMAENLTSLVGKRVVDGAFDFVKDIRYIHEYVPAHELEFNFFNRKHKHSDNFNQLMNFIDAKGTMEDIDIAKNALHQFKNKTATKKEIVHHLFEKVIIKPFMRLSDPEKAFIAMQLKELIPESEIKTIPALRYTKKKHRYKVIQQNSDSDVPDSDVSLEHNHYHSTTKNKHKKIRSTKALEYSVTKKPKHQNIIKEMILSLFNKKLKKELKVRKKFKQDRPYRRNADATMANDLTTKPTTLQDKVKSINRNNIEEILNTGKLTENKQTVPSNDTKLHMYRRFSEKNFHFSDISLDAEGLAQDLEHGEGAKVARVGDDGALPLSSDHDTSFWDHDEFISREEDYLEELRKTPAGFPSWLLVNVTTTVSANDTNTTSTTKILLQ